MRAALLVWLDRITDRLLDDPRSDMLTLFVGVGVYTLIWAAIMAPAVLVILWSLFR